MSQRTEGWKWNVDVYDRPGWHSYSWGPGGIEKGPEGEILVHFECADQRGITDDFYVEHHRQVVLESRDGGLSWRETTPRWAYGIPLALSDGTLVEVVDERRMQTRRQQRQRLDDLGLGHIWRDDCLLAWDLWPAHMTEELNRRGLNVWDRQGDGTFVWLPDGVVATHKPSSLVTRTSANGGASWQDNTPIGLDDFVHFGGGFSCGTVLPDDTVLYPFYAVHRRAGTGSFSLDDSEVFVLRSTDRGRSYETIKMGGPIAGAHLNETSLVTHQTGRVVALIRGAEVHCSVSDDGGLTWSTPRPTGIVGGRPLHAIPLASGNILSVYAHRAEPAGIRATISRDAGLTWDVEHEKILRDDVSASVYIGGPGSTQLDDGSIFTYYNLVKGIEITPSRQHCYIAGSRYTEGYVRPSGR